MFYLKLSIFLTSVIGVLFLNYVNFFFFQDKAYKILHLTVSHQQLVIKKVSVPQFVEVSNSSIVLDCEYDLGNSSSQGLVVKWYRNDRQLVYQWIPGRAPQALKPISKYIDLRHEASNDSSSIYRAMNLSGTDLDLNGFYTCVVSTFEEEASEKRHMAVFSE